jgi:prepilin-type N-terminal cleavage/methylation domain-containing protein
MFVAGCRLRVGGRSTAARRFSNLQQTTHKKHRHGFTLIECLSAMFLMAMVLPAVNLGIAAATKTAGLARHRSEAAGLASSQLSQLIASGQWQGGTLSGDFGPDWPDYRWSATVQNWANDTQGVGLQQLDVTVTWPQKGPQDSVTVSSLVYVRPVPSS